MKKIKLFLAAMAAMVGIQSYAWDAPTKPAYSASEWATPTAGQTYYIYNVGAGTFLGGGRNWGTRATSTVNNIWADGDAVITPSENNDYALPFTLSNNNGTWQLQHKGTNKGNKYLSHDGNASWIDFAGSDTKTYWSITPVDDSYLIKPSDAEANISFGVHGTNLVSHSTAYTWADINYATFDLPWVYWKFVPESEAASIKAYAAGFNDAWALYEAKIVLYNTLIKAESEGASTTEAGTTYTNAEATLSQVNEAVEALNTVRYNHALDVASDSDPRDITEFVLTNADFSIVQNQYTTPQGWETDYQSGVQATNIGFQNNRTYTNGNVTISQFIEAWRPSNQGGIGNGYLRQTVHNMPEGKYVLEADAIAVNQGNASATTTGAFLFINADGVDFKTALSTGNESPQHFSTEFLFSGEGDVMFGLKTENTSANWIAADNFKVTFYGIDLSAYETQLATEVSNFDAVKNSLAETIKTALQNQVDVLNTTYNSSKSYATAIANMQTINAYAAAYVAATAARDNSSYGKVTGSELTALTSAISDAPTYADYATYAAKTTALTTATTAFTAAAPSYDAYVAYKNETNTLWGTDFNVTAPTTAAEAVTAVQNLKVAQYNKVATDYQYSLTSKIGDFSTWIGTAKVGTPREDGTPNSLSWEHWSGVTHPYYEQDGNGYNNEGGWTIQYTKTTTLPAGSYVVKVAARSSAGVTSRVTCTALPGVEISLPCAGNRARGINTSGAASWSDSDTFVYGNGTDFAAAEGGVGSGWEWRFLPFTLDAETEVTMTFYAEASTKSQWMSIGDGELLCTENLATDVAYSEDVDNTIVDVDPANVTITRNVKVGYNTVVLPFDITIGQMEAAFGTGAEVYTFSENSDSEQSVSLNFTKNNAGTISANVPVLVKATTASNKQTFNGVQVVAPTDAAKFAGKYVDYVGVYSLTELAAGDFFLATQNGEQKIFQSQGLDGNKDTVKPFRAYFQKKVAGNVKAALFIDGVATAIEGINADVNNDAEIFNLAGQRVNKAQRGIYIINGKKVLVK